MKNLNIGWSRCDISTDKPVIMPGQAYLRVSKGIHDPITATALVLEQEGEQAVFVSVDMVGPGSDTLTTVRRKVKELCPEIDSSKIIMNYTHTHAGGARAHDASNFSCGPRPEDRMPVGIEVASSDEYIDEYTSKMAQAVADAWSRRSPGGIAYGYGYATVAHSRRVCYFDDVSLRGTHDKTDTFAVNGHAVMYGKTNDTKFSHYEAGTESFINLMYTFDTEGKLTGAVVNVPCPSQNSELSEYLSASFWNEVRENISAKYGDIFILPQAACAGDLSPRILHYKEAQKRRFRLKYEEQEESIAELNARRDIAERICNAFDEVLDWAKKDIQTELPLCHSVRTIELDRRIISEDEYAYCLECYKEAENRKFVETDDPAADFKANSKLLSDRNRFLGVMNRYEAQKTQKKLPMELHTVRIGELAFAFNPFELYMDFQHRLIARSPFIQTFCVELCAPADGMSGTRGYLCTERGEAGKGYSAIIFSCNVSPAGGQELVEETLCDLEKLADKA